MISVNHDRVAMGQCNTEEAVWLLDMKLRHSIRAVSGVPLSSSGLERRY